MHRKWSQSLKSPKGADLHRPASSQCGLCSCCLLAAGQAGAAACQSSACNGWRALWSGALLGPHSHLPPTLDQGQPGTQGGEGHSPAGSCPSLRTTLVVGALVWLQVSCTVSPHTGEPRSGEVATTCPLTAPCSLSTQLGFWNTQGQEEESTDPVPQPRHCLCGCSTVVGDRPRLCPLPKPTTSLPRKWPCTGEVRPRVQAGPL